MSFVDPSVLSLASPSSSYSDIDPTHESGPSRKRPRTTATTSEDRKEARAHRNRIAAQNSRDKRKAQFSYLERRVAELEEENRILRAGGLVPPPPTLPISAFGTLPTSDNDRLRRERENQRERENEELKARIRTLERGWETVLKALAAQGVPLSVPSSTTVSAPAQIPTPTHTSPFSTSHTTSPAPITPPANISNSVRTTSPSPSHDSNPCPSPSFTSNDSSVSTPIRTGTTEPQIHDESTRHLARVATIEPSQAPMSLQRVISSSLPSHMPYIRALQLKQWSMTTRRCKTSSVRSSRPRSQRIRHFYLLRGFPQRKR